MEPREIIVDLFAGGGGASTAILMATGRHPDVAVNHNPDAIGVHEANHPTTRHYACGVHDVEPLEACTIDGVVHPVGLLWASPDCTHFSKARGGKPVEKRIRSLADIVVVWARWVKPRVIALENVEEFQDWGPVLENGQPCPENKGLDFRRWVKALEDLGYAVDWRELVAADYGAPTTRKRLFLIARCDGEPIRWPEPTHAKRDAIAKGAPAAFGKKPWRAAAEILDWSQRPKSIFGRDRELRPKTKARIAKGVKRHVVHAARPFLVPITHTGPGRVHDILDPTRTVTGANRGEFSLVSPTLVPRYGERPCQEPRTRDPLDPYPTVVPDGNGGGLAATVLQKMNQNGVGTDPGEPLYTAMAGAPRHYEVTAFLARQFGSTVSGRDLGEPAPAVMPHGHGGKSGVAAVHLSSIAYGEGWDRPGTRARDAEDPLGVVTQSNDHTAVAAYMIQHNGERIGRSAEEPVTSLTDRSTQQQILAASLDKYYATGVAADVADPLDTATAKARFSMTGAYMEQANTGMVGHSLLSPVSTIVGKGCTQRLIEVGMIPANDHDATSSRAHVIGFLWDHFGEPTADEWADPLATPDAHLKFGLVILDGTVWQIVDIGMRMLTPRELFNAQGFPPNYIIDRRADGTPVTKTSQTSQAGNSVSPPPAEAMLRVNLTWMSLPERRAA